MLVPGWYSCPALKLSSLQWWHLIHPLSWVSWTGSSSWFPSQMRQYTEGNTSMIWSYVKALFDSLLPGERNVIFLGRTMRLFSSESSPTVSQAHLSFVFQFMPGLWFPPYIKLPHELLGTAAKWRWLKQLALGTLGHESHVCSAAAAGS